MSRADRLERRREAKFERHALTIKEQESTEERKGQTLHFNYAVFAGQHLVGRATRYRHALKRAHQFARDHRR